ncbi:hypothetical protein AX17_005303 [Amanita inopinata Kibby_2008]|nr:hypothetical protein AX17_005303 [Amanita inopinata Kibby_2008]
MRSLVPLHLYLTVLNFTAIVYALSVPFDIHIGTVTTRLGRRAPIPVGNTGNAQYVANMTFGGKQARVLLDTGSSDLWVNFAQQAPSAVDLGKTLTLDYAIGKASGNVHATRVGFGNYTLDNQAFLLVEDTSTFTSDIHGQGYDGLFGLGNNDGSVVHKKIEGTAGDTFLARVFEQNKQSNNYITFLLDRKYDPNQAFKGQLTISEVVSGFENIINMPKLDVDKVNRLLKGDQHWQALTDKDTGIIGPDGQPIKIDSIVANAPKGQLVAVFDSGFTFSQVPRDVADAIYGRVQGAVYNTKTQYWTVPCGQYLNLTINFGGVSYPIHPLDSVDDSFHIFDDNGNRVCIGTFQPITSAFSLFGHYDMILGMNFLRNAYALLDFGDWTDGTSDNRAHPYIQLMSVTHADAAKKDFVQVRLNGQDQTGDPRFALLPESQMQHSPVSEEEKKKKYQEMVLSRWPAIFVGCFIFTVLLVGSCVWKCCCRRGKDGRRRLVWRGRKDDGMGQLEKDGLALPSTIPGSGSGMRDSVQPVYVPLEEHRNSGFTHMEKTPSGTYDVFARSSNAGTTAKIPAPSMTYGTEYDDNGAYGSYNTHSPPYASRAQLVGQEQVPFTGGFPPGLEYSQRGSAYSYGSAYSGSSYGNPAYGQPNYGHGGGYHTQYGNP